jgi:sensor histidine kinase YesM
MSILRRISNYWWCQLLGWGLVGLSILFYAYTFRQEISGAYVLKILIVIVSGITSTHLLRLFIKRKNWLLLPIERVLLRMGIAVILTSLLFSLMVMGLNEVFDLTENNKGLDFSTRLFANILNIGIYIIPWVLLYYIYHYIEKSRRQQVDTLKLETLVKELELKTIKSHINPHFIFNALNSIRALIDENPTRARRAITELSNILRSSMQTEKQETVPFEKELNIVKDYLALEHIRFEDRLRIEYSIDEDTLDQPVPPMMLQTLVENAIKHGIGKQVNGGVVKVVSDFKDNFHELIVQNSGHLNGVGNGDGFGLSSTKNRLHLLFGDKANFEIRQVEELVEAKVQIPVVIN